MNNTKILFITPYSFKYFGGVQTQIKIAKKYLVEKGYQVKILANGSNDFNIKSFIPIKFNGSTANVSFSCEKNVLKEALNWADVIHIHEPFIPIMFWGIKTNKPIFTTHHAALSIIISKLLSLIYTIKNKNLEIQSTYVSNLAKNQANALDKNSMYIPNYYEVPNIDISNTNRRRLTFIGRNEPRKGLKIFINAVDSYILNRYVPTVITDKSIKLPYIETHINISNDHKKAILKETQFFVVPYIKNESFGIVILEAISHGCIVITSEIKAFKQILNKTGIYFDTKNSYSLNKVIKGINKKDCKVIWKLQKENIEKYEIKRIMPIWEDLYIKKLLSRKNSTI